MNCPGNSFAGNDLIRCPLPKQYLTDGPRTGGTIKVRPSAFIVDEIPLYEPSGEGEHLYLRLQTEGVSHGAMMSCLRRHFNVHERAIGYAGMKDKHAITGQTVSILGVPDPPDLNIPHDGIQVQWAARHRNKLRRGHLIGNRFAIRIRDVDPIKAPVAQRVLNQLERDGVPAYFGPQRFGNRRNNHLLGAAILNGQWPEAVAELLGPDGAPFPEFQREQREHFAAGRFDEALAQWSPSERAEVACLRKLRDGASPKQAMRAAGMTLLTFWAGSTASAAFNRTLDERLASGTLGALNVGDLAFKHDSRAVFAVTEETLDDPETAGRLARLEISPSGPLWGAKMTEAAGATGQREDDARAATGADQDAFRGGRFCPDGARRPHRVKISNADVEGGFDEHGGFVRIAFDLPRGMYATVVLRELMGDA